MWKRRKKGSGLSQKRKRQERQDRREILLLDRNTDEVIEPRHVRRCRFLEKRKQLDRKDRIIRRNLRKEVAKMSKDQRNPIRLRRGETVKAAKIRLGYA